MGGILVEHHDPDLLIELPDIAERIGVGGERLAGTEIPIDFGKAFAVCKGNALETAAPVEGGILVIDVMIAGQNQNGDPGILEPLQLPGQTAVADLGAVEGQIPGEKDHVGGIREHLVQKGIRDFLHIGHELAVAVFQDLLIAWPAVRQLRRDIMKVAGNHRAKAAR